MEDPATLGLNLTFFGTLGLALIMFIGLAILVAITLVLAGIAKLVSVILLAMLGVYPKRETDSIVHLPPRPRRKPARQQGLDDWLPEAGYAESAAPPPVKQRPGFFATAKAVYSAGWASIRNVPWKSVVDPRTWPKPAEIGAGLASTATSVAASQAKEHPLVVAVKDPHVLNSKWAAAVAEADARAAARAGDAVVEHPAASRPGAPNPSDSPNPSDRLPRDVREHAAAGPHGSALASGKQAAGIGGRPRP
ncbi:MULTISPECIES: hypothetical protein [Arthrobacter]|uniref:Uncharacterized protein n=1 Tax=Arthrobacter terricola TaxID=2547396 RepID=A0A4V2ZRV5_9MICC|nr:MULTISPECIES: hypothetical protein [Arthrobacter]MBT8163436.1 hypothetical protein [Arthrobacter sp. GN70]TDF90074.1 hypothetical protein E1809_22590 [Arthrobacter terricola]